MFCHTSSSIRTVTVGPGVAPSQRTLSRPVADYTASGEFRPALKTFIQLSMAYYTHFSGKCNPQLEKWEELEQKFDPR